MDVRPHCICDDFFSATAVMYVYECIPRNKSRACSLAKNTERLSCKLYIIAITAITAIIVRSIIQLIAIICNNKHHYI